MLPEDGIRIVCFGDSVTKGVRVGVKPDQTFCSTLSTNLKQEGIPCKIINAGVGGNTTSDALVRLDRDVLDHKPSHVIIMFGINDSWVDVNKTHSRVSLEAYTANLKNMIDRVRSQGGIPILMTPNPVVSDKFPAKCSAMLRHYADAARALAKREKVFLVDVYAKFLELGQAGDSLESLTVDNMHPNPKGHSIISEMLTAQVRGLIRKNKP